MGGSPVKNNSSSVDLHKSDTESPISSIIIFLMLISVIAIVIFMFKDQIKLWLNKDKKILKKSDDKPLDKIETSDSSDAEPKANEDGSQIQFEIEQPQLEEKLEENKI